MILLTEGETMSRLFDLDWQPPELEEKTMYEMKPEYYIGIAQIDEEHKKLFEMDYYDEYHNSDYEVFDAVPNNVLYGIDGDLYFIDTQIRLLS